MTPKDVQMHHRYMQMFGVGLLVIVNTTDGNANCFQLTKSGELCMKKWKDEGTFQPDNDQSVNLFTSVSHLVETTHKLPNWIRVHDLRYELSCIVSFDMSQNCPTYKLGPAFCSFDASLRGSPVARFIRAAP